ncbi:conserved hypothetical protein [Talaromyces stipitatus ATCC 10500]|uniref:Bacteriophage T5 Orf172 DNA-binding domain-containing protein n=1 Tax=Talaromyces stipitatus (strain ATCC 10500 / CBS 375.48 / QM 6759 / NRRL 1006) TaxID=441959 RepID=B8M9V5_TALSN|nr:uncharacterized protein TSTA_118730 [Talaromyces stipitatus ATCC 10500]EED18107.1 conserved hypothetical protein [Talaromyces stipitatus ATCC 10500]
MPQFPNTPESILPRSDSRNPASTCRGITVNGKPCRRSLAASQSASASKGVVARLKGQNQQLDPSAFYCWQHKNQAPEPGDISTENKQAQAAAFARKTSIDSLIERLGILEVNDRQRQHRRPTERDARYQRMHSDKNPKPGRGQQPRQSPFCCFTIVEDSENLPAAKRVQSSRREKPVASRPPATPQRPVFVRDPRSGGSPIVQQRSAPVTPRRWSETTPQATLQSADRSQYLGTPTKPSLPSTPNSHSSQNRPLLSLIPQHLSPQTTALLLTELSKPISNADEEGYIYIFWVTPQKHNSEAPPGDIALNLLPPPGRPNHSRRTSDALRAAQAIDPRSKGSANQPGTIRLKIGRTSNVHRRLNEYYPYTNSSPSPSPARRPESEHFQGHGRRVPHVHRVERLIHIELADQRVKGKGPCAQCNKEHREWFEFNATKDALKLVDDCVRRWVAWGEQHI